MEMPGLQGSKTVLCNQGIMVSIQGEQHMKEGKNRIQIIDALRGFAVMLMVIHHLLYNFVYFLDAPKWLFTNPVFDILHYFFAGLFIFLSGVSSRFSRSNIRRGLIAIAFALAISAVTFYMEMPIWFGVLHLLGFSMLFFGLISKLRYIINDTDGRNESALRNYFAPVIFIILIAASSLATANFKLRVESSFLRILISVLGWPQQGFVSYDYFPILPWIFVFLLGTWAGLYIVARKLPNRFYEAELPFFPAVGRKALLIYILHQPVLYAVVMGISALFGAQR